MSTILLAWELGHGLGHLSNLRPLAKALKQRGHNVVVCEHSPTALLAARGFGARCVLLGHGFYCPGDVYPLADLRPWLGNSVEYRKRVEDRILDRVNVTLRSFHVEPLEQLGRLFSQVDANFLLSFPELDNYRDRHCGEYLGGIADFPGEPPRWPPGVGKKVFVYVRPIPAMAELLMCLGGLCAPTIIFCPELNMSVRRRFQAANMNFEDSPLDLRTLSQECDLAILNGGHGTTVAMLAAGKPVLMLPIFLEQRLTSMAAEALGVGRNASIKRRDEVSVALRDVISTESYVRAARDLSDLHRDMEAKAGLNRVLDRLCELAQR